MVTAEAIISKGHRVHGLNGVMCNNVLNLLCNVSVFIDDEDDDVYTRKQ